MAQGPSARAPEELPELPAVTPLAMASPWAPSHPLPGRQSWTLFLGGLGPRPRPLERPVVRGPACSLPPPCGSALPPLASPDPCAAGLDRAGPALALRAPSRFGGRAGHGQGRDRGPPAGGPGATQAVWA